MVRETLRTAVPILFYPEEVKNEYAARDVDGPIQYWKQLSDELAEAHLKFVLLMVPNKYTIYYPMLREPARGQPQGSRYLKSLEAGSDKRGFPSSISPMSTCRLQQQVSARPLYLLAG